MRNLVADSGRGLTCNIAFLLIATIAVVAARNSQAYEVLTHADISERAVSVSILNRPGLLPQLGLKEVPPNDLSQLFPSTRSSQSLSIVNLVRLGAQLEDDTFINRRFRLHGRVC